MKRIASIVVISAALAAGYTAYPEQFQHYIDVANKALVRVWDNIEANPAPVALALGTFVLTVGYHKARGKSLRESVEVAATRVTVVPVGPATGDSDNAVVRRAKARATRTQLLTDQIGLENRQRRLPEAVSKAEKDACYTEQALADAERLLNEKQKAHAEAVARLESLRKEKAEGEAELAAIETELKKLADMV